MSSLLKLAAATHNKAAHLLYDIGMSCSRSGESIRYRVFVLIRAKMKQRPAQVSVHLPSAIGSVLHDGYVKRALREFTSVASSWLLVWLLASCSVCSSCQPVTACHSVHPDQLLDTVQVTLPRIVRLMLCGVVQKSFGQCSQSWMSGYCKQTCGKCSC